MLSRKDCVHIIMKNEVEVEPSSPFEASPKQQQEEFTEAFVKDLRLLLNGRDLKDIILVDDKVSSYAA